MLCVPTRKTRALRNARLAAETGVCQQGEEFPIQDVRWADYPLKDPSWATLGWERPQLAFKDGAAMLLRNGHVVSNKFELSRWNSRAWTYGTFHK